MVSGANHKHMIKADRRRKVAFFSRGEAFDMGDYFDLKQTDLKLLEHSEGRICIVVHPDGKLDQTARRLNRLTKGAIERLFLDDGFSSRKSGEIVSLPFPAGMKAKSIDVLILERTANTKERRLAGAGLAKRIGTSHANIFAVV